jgi:DNA-binding NtrC family response regulator
MFFLAHGDEVSEVSQFHKDPDSGIFKKAISGKPQLSGSAEEPETAGSSLQTDAFPDRLPTLRESEDCLIAEALRRADGNQGVAAGLLGLSRQALNKRLSRRREGDGSADLNGESDVPR